MTNGLNVIVEFLHDKHGYLLAWKFGTKIYIILEWSNCYFETSLTWKVLKIMNNVERIAQNKTNFDKWLDLHDVELLDVWNCAH